VGDVDVSGRTGGARLRAFGAVICLLLGTVLLAVGAAAGPALAQPEGRAVGVTTVEGAITPVTERS
jgi:hypothetical protein